LRRPDRPEDLDRHAIIAFGGTLENVYFSKWLRKTAPSARVAARSETVIGALIAVKAGEGLGILPVQLGDTEQDLVRVIGPLSELRAQFYLLVHPDLKDAPRVRAFIDFIVVAIDAYQPLLLGQTR
jgi:DNA-binding transcriptional LysR family regulator